MADAPKPQTPPAAPAQRPQDATRSTGGQFQTVADWMRKGGLHESVRR
jgi:hypothetical protein